MNYTIHQLEVFLRVAREKSITKAAEALFMTQPAVSMQLKNFQDQFDLPLYEVIGRQLYITDFGQEIVEQAGRVMHEMADIQYKMAAYKGLIAGKLHIASASTGKYVLPFFLAEFLAQNPGIDLVLDVTNKRAVVEQLKNNEIDFAFVSVPPENINIEEELFLENRLYLVSNEANPHHDKPLIHREEGSATRVAMEQYFGTNKGNQRKQMELTSNEAVKQAVIAGLGNSIMPLIGIKNEIFSKELFLIPAEGLPIATQWRLTWLKGKRLSPVAKAFLGFIREHKTQLLELHFGWYQQFR